MTHFVRVPEEVDVRALRKRFKLSQAQFAAKFGLDARALQQWEQKRRHPDRATRILLTVIDEEPKAVERALAKA
ncbi:MAG TPA: helix-turn-helix domain-containing protein [Stellaceae bacterium]|nr:helix-turn-helix domain-containing protein [Stellaceae bacterium]